MKDPLSVKILVIEDSLECIKKWQWKPLHPTAFYHEEVVHLQLKLLYYHRFSNLELNFKY